MDNWKTMAIKKEYPKQLAREEFFKTPIWFANAEDFIKKLNKASDPYIVKSKIKAKSFFKERKNILKKNEKYNYAYHSTSLTNDKNFKDFKDFVQATSYNLLDEMGYDLKNYRVIVSEIWVQEFSEEGGGNHSPHVHWNGHISGFYFLKGSEKTSRPIFHDPRIGQVMNSLPKKQDSRHYSNEMINYDPTPGKFIFFPSYLSHEFTVDPGCEPFRFIHFNCRAISLEDVNEFQKK